MDEDSLTEEEMATLKRAFAEADCAVKDLNESCFEISHKEYSVVTHVRDSVFSPAFNGYGGPAQRFPVS
ncbi:MAG TPA: hypothetical protein VFA77_14295, partial [Candidatus Eisenbacteria bacterium]|nr:hypothetical protein [Candidatus Eisenbacteria bacterium]